MHVLVFVRIVQNQIEDIIEAEVEEQVKLQLGFHSMFNIYCAPWLINALNASCSHSPTKAPRERCSTQAPARRGAICYAQLVRAFYSPCFCTFMLTVSKIHREARRANGQLRSNNLHGPMQTLMAPSGLGKHLFPIFLVDCQVLMFDRIFPVSDHFPKDMSELLTMDAETVAALIAHYDIAASDNREENMNRFMRFCNIGYQVVPMNPLLAVTDN